MTRPNQQPGPADDQPWYFKYGVRFLGITGAFCKYYQTVWKIQRSLLFAMFGSIFCVPFLFGGRFFDFVVYMSMWRMFVARVCMPSLLAWSLIINLRSCCIAAAAWFFGGQTLKTKQWFVCPPCKMNRVGIEWGISMCVRVRVGGRMGVLYHRMFEMFDCWALLGLKCCYVRWVTF